ncbi:MAG: dihydrolipoamide acetyltransferase family protein [Candidatus Kapabacteria bacterium]|nr:dihydrolipoamide acetyltransferase family protein [Candidatus Kapabacteria bacterium]
MKIDVIMPKMGESLQEGTITKWLKSVGDKVDRDEMILEISTDKVDTEVPSPAAGVLSEIINQTGETVDVGKVIAYISTDYTEEENPPIIVETKAAPEPIAAPVTGTEAMPSVAASIMAEFNPPAESDEKRFYSPVVKEIAKENNLSAAQLSEIQGSGADGRVTKKDILAYLDNKAKSTVQPAIVKKSETAPSAMPAPASQAIIVKPASSIVSIGDDDEIIPMDRMRKLIAEHMVYSKHTSPHVTSVSEADVTGIVKYVKKHGDAFMNKEGFKLTYTPFFTMAAIRGLKEFPMVNVSVDGSNIIRHRRINFGMATVLDDGNLIVPVAKNADALSFTGLARAFYDLATRARSKKLNPDDIQGGTFTLTNVGVFGTLFGTPIINQPQAAILGVGAIKKRPMVIDVDGEDHIAVRNMAYISITYDHRIIDGALAGRYLNFVCRTLESMGEGSIVL